MEPEKKRKLLYGALVGAGAVLLLLIIIFMPSFHSEEDAPPEAQVSSFQVPDDELLIDDLYEGKRLIPKYELELNQYDRKKFAVKDGFLRYDHPNARLGVDVSEYQGEIDWPAVKAAGMDFAILRLGYRGSTKGLLNVDETFRQNFEGATGAGLFVGVYFFSQAISVEEAEAEADFVVQTLGGRKLAYPVVFDWEPPAPTADGSTENFRTRNMKGDQVTELAAAFCKKIKAAGYSPCVYTNKSMAYEFFDLAELKDCDLWYAEYQNAPSLYYNFRLWQYTEEGQVPGIEGFVDLDICFKPY